MVYVVPVTQTMANTSSKSFLTMNIPQDATYFNKDYKSSTILLAKGKYIRAERFNSVIGKTNPDFFRKILQQLAIIFDFTNSIKKTAVLSSSIEKTIAEPSCSEKTLGKSETALLEFFGYAFDKLD